MERCYQLCLYAFCLLILSETTSDVQASTSCSSDLARHAAVTLDARRNATGYWIMTVDAESVAGPSGQPRVRVKAELFTSPIRPGVVLLSSTAVIHPEAPPNYELILDQGYYKLHTEGRPWPEAMRVCEAEGAHLMVIDSQAESRVIQELFARQPSITKAHNDKWLAIGFHDRYVNNRYDTVTGERLSDKYVKWLTGEPAGPNQHCGIINKDADMAIDPCTTSWAFVCEAY